MPARKLLSAHAAVFHYICTVIERRKLAALMIVFLLNLNDTIDMLQDDEVKNDCAGLFPTHEENIAIIDLCLSLAMSDGDLTDAEESVLNQVFDFLSVNDKVYLDYDRYYNWSNAVCQSSDDAVDQLQKMPIRHRVLTIDLLRLVAKADGDINFWEEYFISAVKVKLDV